MRIFFKRSLLFIVLVLCIALALSACSSSSNSSSEKGKVEKSAIEEELFGKTSAVQALKKLNDKSEALIEECMSSKGWKYFKQTTSISDAQGFGITYIDPNFADNTKREKYGYGIYTFTKSDGSTDEEAMNEYYGGFGLNDKNTEYEGSLSPEEQVRYQKDLYGISQQGFSENSDQDSSDLDTGDGVSTNGNSSDFGGFDKDAYKKSCNGQALEKGFGDISDLEKVGRKLINLNEEFKKNKGVKAAAKEWKACVVAKLKKDKDKSLADKVAKKLTSPITVNNDISAVIQPKQLGSKSSNPSDASDSANDDSMLVGTSLPSGGSDSPGYDPADLESKQKFEIRLAALDYSCQDEKYLVPVSKLARQQEEKFIKENKSTITKLKTVFEKNS